MPEIRFYEKKIQSKRKGEVFIVQQQRFKMTKKPHMQSITCRRTDGTALKYTIGSRLGEGSFGSVYDITKAVDTASNVTVSSKPLCIKIEPIVENKEGEVNRSFLRMEFRAYEALQRTGQRHFFPRVIDYGLFGNSRFLLMEKGGPSLEGCWNKLKPKQKLESFRQSLCALQTMHECGLLHRDIKPANILVQVANRGASQSARTVHTQLIDMGFVKRFRTGPNATHIPNRKKTSLTGTLDFVSVHVLEGQEYDRRCDLESLVYTFAAVMGDNSLPWSRMLVRRQKADGNRTTSITIQMLLKMKRETPAHQVAGKKAPPCLSAILRLIRKLEFGECPDYKQMLRLIDADLKPAI